MNKYEKLIEHIINDDEQAARKLFHQIVVEKSRDIYESLMDEELGGNPAEEMVDDITNEVEMDEEGLAEEELDTEVGDSDDEVDFEMDDNGDGDLPVDTDADMGSEEDLEDRVMDLESELEQLKAEFDKLMGDEDHGDHEDKEAHDDHDSDEEFDTEESDEDLEESAKDEEDLEEQEEEGEEVHENRSPRSQTDLMREYVEKVKEFYKGEAHEGEPVGSTGGKTNVNTKSTVAGKNDMGGSTANIAKGGSEQNPDGTQFKAPKNEYSKKSGELPHAGKFQNVPGAKAKAEATGKSYEKAHGKEGQTTSGSVPVNTKSEISGKVR